MWPWPELIRPGRKMKSMNAINHVITFAADGTARCLWTEAVPLQEFGVPRPPTTAAARNAATVDDRAADGPLNVHHRPTANAQLRVKRRAGRTLIFLRSQPAK